MLQVNRTQFQQIKTHFAKLRSELNKEKLAEFETNLTFFAEYAPYAPAGDLVTRQEFNELAKEVGQARRASLTRNGETSEYSRYKANAARGIDAHPDCKSHTHAEIMAQLRKSPELRQLASGIAGLSKEELKRELPQ